MFLKNKIRKKQAAMKEKERKRNEKKMVVTESNTKNTYIPTCDKN